MCPDVFTKTTKLTSTGVDFQQCAVQLNLGSLVAAATFGAKEIELSRCKSCFMVIEADQKYFLTGLKGPEVSAGNGIHQTGTSRYVRWCFDQVRMTSIHSVSNLTTSLSKS
jgi:hypothetical protein